MMNHTLKNLYLKRVSTNGLTLNTVPDPYNYDADIITAAITQNGMAYQSVPNSATNKQLVMIAVKQNGNVLKYADDDMKDDFDVVSYAF